MATRIPKTAANLNKLIDIANIDLPMNIEGNLARLSGGQLDVGSFATILSSKRGINRSWEGITKQINSSNMTTSARRMSGGAFFQAEGNRLLSEGINVADAIGASERDLKRVTGKIRASMLNRSPGGLGKLGGQIDQLEEMREHHAKLLAAKSIQSHLIGPSEMTATSQEIKEKILAKTKYSGMGIFGLNSEIRKKTFAKEGAQGVIAGQDLTTAEGLKVSQQEQSKIRTIDKELKGLQEALGESTKTIKSWSSALQKSGTVFSEAGKMAYGLGVDLPTATLQTKAAIGGVYNARFSDYMSLTNGPDAGAQLRLQYHDTAVKDARNATGWAKGSAVAGTVGSLASTIGTGLIAGGIASSLTGVGASWGVPMIVAGTLLGMGNDVISGYKSWTVGGGQAGVNRYQAAMNEYMAGQEQQRIVSQKRFDIAVGGVANATAMGGLAGLNFKVLDSKSTTIRGTSRARVESLIAGTSTPGKYVALEDTEILTRDVPIGPYTGEWRGEKSVRSEKYVNKYWKAVEKSPGYNSYLSPQEQVEAGAPHFLATGRGGGELEWAERLKKAGITNSQAAAWSQTLGTTGAVSGRSIDSLAGNRSDISSYMISGMVGLRSGIANTAASYGMDVSHTANAMVRGAYPEGSNYFRFTEAKAAYSFYDQRREQGKNGLDLPQALSQLRMTSLLGVRGAAAMSDLSLTEAKDLLRNGVQSDLWKKGFGTEGYDFKNVMKAAQMRINSMDTTTGGMIFGDEGFTTKRMQGMAPKSVTDIALKEGKEGKTLVDMTPKDFEDSMIKAFNSAQLAMYLNTEQKGDIGTQFQEYGKYMESVAKTIGAEITKQIKEGMEGMEFKTSTFTDNTFLK